MAENGKVIVTGCMGAEPEKITAKYPNVLAITGPQQYESVLDAVAPRRAAATRSVPRSGAAEGIKLTPRHYAYLKISEAATTAAPSASSQAARRSRLAPGRRCAARGRAAGHAGVKELLVISQDTSAYGVDIKYAASKWKDHEVRAKFFDLSRELGTLGAWVRLHYVYPYRTSMTSSSSWPTASCCPISTFRSSTPRPRC